MENHLRKRIDSSAIRNRTDFLYQSFYESFRVLFVDSATLLIEAPEKCDFCASELKTNHKHSIEPSTRAIVCVCDVCALGGPNIRGKFNGARYKSISEQSFLIADLNLPDEVWNQLSIPFGMAFFFFNSSSNKIEVFFPSPAGAIESELSDSSSLLFENLNPELRMLSEEDNKDVLALLINKTKESPQYYLTPIHECYKLIGLMRKNQRGGIYAMQNDIDIFFKELSSKSKEHEQSKK